MTGGAEVRHDEISGTLVDNLQAISSPNRLRLLSLLREPHTVSDINLQVTVDQGNPERCISRQGVRHHLNKLRKAGFVEVRSADTNGRRVHEYVADPRKLYELGEILRLMPMGETPGPGDLGAPPTWDPPSSAAPTLTVVHGAEIGRSFPLQGEPNQPARGWVIGQSPEVDIPLSWDPYVDAQAGEIERSGGSFRLIDLRVTERPVSLNGRVLERGETRELEDGDLVGVGRSLLCFRE